MTDFPVGQASKFVDTVRLPVVYFGRKSSLLVRSTGTRTALWWFVLFPYDDTRNI